MTFQLITAVLRDISRPELRPKRRNPVILSRCALEMCIRDSGGSHQAWAEGYAAHSAHMVELLTLPARFWKWRMHGGAVTLARRWLAEAGGLSLIHI